MAKIIDLSFCVKPPVFQDIPDTFELLKQTTNGSLEYIKFERRIIANASPAESMMSTSYQQQLGRQWTKSEFEFVKTKSLSIESYCSELQNSLKIELQNEKEISRYKLLMEIFEKSVAILTIVYPELLILKSMNWILLANDAANSYNNGELKQFYCKEALAAIINLYAKQWMSVSISNVRFIRKMTVDQRDELVSTSIEKMVDAFILDSKPELNNSSPTLNKMWTVHNFRMVNDINYARKYTQGVQKYQSAIIQNQMRAVSGR